MTRKLRPDLLLLDFDRTLATTKAGASPMQNGAQGTTKTAVDPELKAAIVGQPPGGAHVVTRNSHKVEIEQFLLLRGIEGMEVHVVPKNETKGAFIQRTFFYNTPSAKRGAAGAAAMGDARDVSSSSSSCSSTGSTGATEPRSCLFVDDDIRELVSDPWLCTDARVHRLLFVRALG